MIANLLTASRLLLIPVIFHFILAGESGWALGLFAIGAMTDFLDGAVARLRDEVTELGRVLDPLTDRLFISSIVVALFLREGFGPPLWALVVLLGRDTLMLAGSAWLKWLGQPIEVTMVGKVATAVMLVAILLLVAGSEIGLWFFYVGLALYVVSGYIYLIRGKNVWKSSRKATQQVERY